MRPSALRHPVAVLRTFLGLKQPEFAKLVGCSPATIQSIELGPERLEASFSVAFQISDATGVDHKWIINGDPLAPMMDRFGNPYSIEVWEVFRDARRASGEDEDSVNFCTEATQLTWMLFAIIEMAASAHTPEFRWRTLAGAKEQLRDVLQSFGLYVDVTGSAQAERFPPDAFQKAVARMAKSVVSSVNTAAIRRALIKKGLLRNEYPDLYDSIRKGNPAKPETPEKPRRRPAKKRPSALR
jgi:DNA-binding XRE family transcriptional regulator